MDRYTFSNHRILWQLTTQLLFTGLLLSNPTYAENHTFASDSKVGKQAQNNHSKHNDQTRYDHRREAEKQHQRQSEYGHSRDRRESRHKERNVSLNVYFGDQHRAYIHDYYQPRFHAGRCPPGLAKRHNGCMPPGLERNWRMGYPLPREVIYYDLPPTVLVQLGAPPPRHRYVRVAADILLIAIGTGMVVDAIEDIGNR